MKLKYVNKRFNDEHLKLIEYANTIIEEYEAQGYDLTLRQLYYQFVSRDLIPNTLQEYKRLGGIINDARLGGLVSWEAIVDRTRNLKRNSHWDGPKDAIESIASQYQIDKWENQDTRVEVWVEKDALIGVIEKVCQETDCPYFACRGYTSQSEMWGAAQRLNRYKRAGQRPVIIHLGDHDPSGIDMTRDIEDRLTMFLNAPVEVNRIALNMNQVRKYNPPPNPAKTTDARSGKYIKEHGYESWELDALEPRILNALILKTILKYRNEDLWDEMKVKEQEHKDSLYSAADELE